MFPGYITVDRVRRYIKDRTPDDNSIDCDLAFSDEEIMEAMGYAAERYNEMEPLGVDMVFGNCLPKSNLFLNLIAEQIYISERQKLARNQMKWSTGGTTVDLEKVRFDIYGQLAKECHAEWYAMAKSRKAEINRNESYGFV